MDLLGRLLCSYVKKTTSELQSLLNDLWSFQVVFQDESTSYLAYGYALKLTLTPEQLSNRIQELETIKTIPMDEMDSLLHVAAQNGELDKLKTVLEFMKRTTNVAARIQNNSVSLVIPFSRGTFSINVNIPRTVTNPEALYEFLPFDVVDYRLIGVRIHNSCTNILELPDSRQETPLHAAAKSGNIYIIDELLSKGANIAARNTDGMNPLALMDVSKAPSSAILSSILFKLAQPDGAENAYVTLDQRDDCRKEINRLLSQDQGIDNNNIYNVLTQINFVKFHMGMLAPDWHPSLNTEDDCIRFAINKLVSMAKISIEVSIYNSCSGRSDPDAVRIQKNLSFLNKIKQCLIGMKTYESFYPAEYFREIIKITGSLANGVLVTKDTTKTYTNKIELKMLEGLMLLGDADIRANVHGSLTNQQKNCLKVACLDELPVLIQKILSKSLLTGPQQTLRTKCSNSFPNIFALNIFSRDIMNLQRILDCITIAQTRDLNTSIDRIAFLQDLIRIGEFTKYTDASFNLSPLAKKLFNNIDWKVLTNLRDNLVHWKNPEEYSNIMYLSGYSADPANPTLLTLLKSAQTSLQHLGFITEVINQYRTSYDNASAASYIGQLNALLAITTPTPVSPSTNAISALSTGLKIDLRPLAASNRMADKKSFQNKTPLIINFARYLLAALIPDQACRALFLTSDFWQKFNSSNSQYDLYVFFF